MITVLVLFLPTLLAVIYEAYHSQTQSAYKKITKKQKSALLRAFDLLTHRNVSTKGMKGCDPLKSSKGSKSKSNANIISKSVWMQFMKVIRPDLHFNQHIVLYTTLRLKEEDLTSTPVAVEYRLNSSDVPDGITRSQFLRLPGL